MGDEPDQPLSPAERLFRFDVDNNARFVAGVVAGHWRLIAITWPYAVIVVAVESSEIRREVALRFNLDGYKAQPPTAAPWDVDRDSILDPAEWPRGGDALNRAFNPNWKRTALYIPYDRAALPGHETWIATRPQYAWGPRCDIATYLRHVCRLLDDDAFLAAGRAA